MLFCLIVCFFRLAFGFPVEILHNKQVLEDPTAWQELVSRQNPADPLEITVQRENPNKIHKEGNNEARFFCVWRTDVGSLFLISNTERAMLQGLSDSCIVIDHIGTILFVNLMTEELFGFESSELVGQNIKVKGLIVVLSLCFSETILLSDAHSS